MSAGIDHSRSSRRPRPEVAVYRPGSGPLKKSSNNAENIQSSSSNKMTSKEEGEYDLVSSLKNVTIGGERKKDKTKLHEPSAEDEPKSKQYSSQKQERNARKSKSSSIPQANSSENKQENCKRLTAIRDFRRPNHLPEKLGSEDYCSNQDLRNFLIEKRLPKSKESPSSIYGDGNLGDPVHNNKSDFKMPFDQSVSNMEQIAKNGLCMDPIKSSSSIVDATSLGRNNEKRGSRRRNERKSKQIENSVSEECMSSLTSVSIENSTNQHGKVTKEKKTSRAGNASSKVNDRRDRTDEQLEFREMFDQGSPKSLDLEIPPKGPRRRRRHNRHGGSRRGSVSSDRVTPVPDLSWADDPTKYERTDDERSERSLLPRPSSQQSFHRNRQSPSPHRGSSKNRKQQDAWLGSQPRSPSRFAPTSTPGTPPQGLRQHPEYTPHQQNAPQVHYYQRANYQAASNRDNRSTERYHASATHDGRPPTGRGVRPDRHALPSNFDSLPPRLKKKFEEERLMAMNERLPLSQPSTNQINHSNDEWDGGSLTFMNASGSRLSHSQSFPAPSSPTRSSGTRPYGQGVLNKSSKGGRANVAGPGKVTYYQEHEDRDVLVSRPRSQDSMISKMSDLSRERKTSFTDSRSPTPSSSLECTAGHQLYIRGNLRRLDEISATQTSLDWGEEMEEEDRRSLAEDPKSLQHQANNKEQIVQFASADVRYQNKPIQGYTVMPSSNGVERSTSVSFQPATHGRPLLGQGRLQESRNDNTSPRMPIPGLIQLPHGSQAESSRHSPRRSDTHAGGTSGPYHPRGPPRQLEARLNDPSLSYRKPSTQRTLFDPSNPHKPIVVGSREEGMPSHVPQTSSLLPCPEAIYQLLPADQGNSSAKPAWYDPQSESFRASKSPPPLLMDIVRCDMELSWLLQGPGIIQRFGRIQINREFIQRSLRAMLTNDLRFCQMENVEQHMWKVAFHNVIEALRKSMSEDPDNKEEHKALLFTVIDDGMNYFEQLLDILQEAHNFILEKYLEPQPYPVLSGLGYVGLAVISCQKILVFLGDLARYREITAETSNYGKAKSWYTKANLANPKNGRPYNQLAILALYARRKLDAVYLYMRSLMASNPFLSARESLVSLFDENRKKYEQQERKRKEAKEANSRRRESSGVLSDAALVDRRGLRREIWIHPSDGHRTRRMTSASATSDAARAHNSDDEELAQLPSIEVNKRFVTSYLNVQGKLYTKIGMETFQECGVQMLREFRALLQQTPLPVKQDRLLQLLALNMFAVSNTQLKDARMGGGCRSAWQECALIVSLEMFNVLLERCNALLKEQLESSNQTVNNRLLGEDLQIILPAIKVWCDWLLCHSLVWNPPPNSRDYHVGPPGTPWTRLAALINLLNKFDTRQVDISTLLVEGYEIVKLPEDVALCGFTPLMLNIQEPHYAPKTCDEDMTADCVRIERLLYFGRDFLCGLDPPVLKLKLIAPSLSEYVSVVDAAANNTNSASRVGQQGISSNDLPEDDNSDDEALLDQLEREEGVDVVVKEGEEDTVIAAKEAAGTVAATATAAATTAAAATDEATSKAPESATNDDAKFKELRQRKDELMQRHHEHERRKKQLRAILQERVQIELEVRPKYLVADTNCYIDHLADLVRLTRDKFYTLVAPLVVLNELDGLCRSRLANEARSALAFLREKNPQVRYVTSKGAPLPTFTAGTMTEESDDQGLTNDDRVLQCCMSLIKPAASDEEGHTRDGVRKLRREVVLLTDDRNLRVKALSRDVPVRDLPAFVTWSSAAVQ